MEMIFLQQAAGVASEKLPNDLIRSMSGANIASGNLLSAQLKSELTNEHLALYEEPLDVGDDLAVKVTDDDEIIRTDDPDTSSPRDRTMTTEEVLKVIDLVHKENIAGDDVDAGEDSRAFAASVELQEAMRMSNVLLPEKYDIFIRSKDSPARESIERFESPPPAHAISPSREGPQVLQSERELLKFKFGEDETSSWKLELCANVDKAIDCLMPSTESIELRMRVFSFLRDMICANLGSQLFPTGSFISNTYLPDSDLDTTCLVLRNDDDSWFVRVNECLCMSSFNSNLPYGADSIVSSKHSSFDTIPEAADYKPAAVSRVSVTNVSFVNSDSKKIRSTINGVIVDISANQVSAIYTQYFTEAIDNYVGRDYLFKRSLLLLKAWSRYESIRYTDNKGSISESRDSKLNSWALTVMLVWIFNCHGDTITHPIQALGRFLRYYTSFDFRQYAITAIGPVNAEDLSQLSDEKAAELRLPRYLFFPEDLIRNCNARYQETLSMSKVSFHDPSDPQLTNSASDHQGSETVAMDGVVSSASMPLSSFAGPVAPAAAASSIAPQKYNSAWILRGAFPEISHEYQRGFVNVIDPLANYNITRALENSDYDSIVDSFGHGYSAFQAMCEEQMQKDESNDSSALASFLQNTYQKINLLPRKTSISMTSRTLLAPQKTDLEVRA